MNTTSPPSPEFNTTTQIQGAVCIIINHKGKILLLKRDDIPSISYPGYWSAPSGKVEPFETPERAATRELWEETGLNIMHIHNLTTQLNPYNGATDHVYTTYVQADDLDIIRGEGCDHGFFSPEEITKSDSSILIVPYIKDIIAQMDIQSFAISQKPISGNLFTLRAPHLLPKINQFRNKAPD